MRRSPLPPKKNSPLLWGEAGLLDPCNTWYLGPSRSTAPYGIVIESAVFFCKMHVRYQRTERQAGRQKNGELGSKFDLMEFMALTLQRMLTHTGPVIL